jgi:hypothetical protein
MTYKRLIRRPDPSLLDELKANNLTTMTVLTMAMDLENEDSQLSENELAKLKGQLNPVLRYLQRDKETKTYVR